MGTGATALPDSLLPGPGHALLLQWAGDRLFVTGGTGARRPALRREHGRVSFGMPGRAWPAASTRGRGHDSPGGCSGCRLCFAFPSVGQVLVCRPFGPALARTLPGASSAPDSPGDPTSGLVGDKDVSLQNIECRAALSERAHPVSPLERHLAGGRDRERGDPLRAWVEPGVSGGFFPLNWD